MAEAAELQRLLAATLDPSPLVREAGERGLAQGATQHGAALLAGCMYMRACTSFAGACSFTALLLFMHCFFASHGQLQAFPDVLRAALPVLVRDNTLCSKL